MTIEQLDVVDSISIDPRGDGVTLSVSDHLPWDDAHLVLLDKKLDGYRNFVEKGGLKKEYGVDPSKTRVSISIFLKFRPDAAGLRFLQAASYIFLSRGFLFEFGPIPTIGYADAI
jgi:hypothetical protein